VHYQGSVEQTVEKYVKSLATVTGGHINLTNHPSRGHQAVPLLRSVRFLNHRGETTNSFGCGESFTIALEVEPVRELEHPHFGIGFNDMLGQRVFSVATYLSSSTLPPLKRPTTVYCRIEELPLVPGTYTLCLSAGTLGHYLMDALEDAIAIEVTPQDFYGNGKLAAAGLGQILMRSSWDLTNSHPGQD
jgi:lipopolysaccharide transport system ATP-binding protein